MGIKHSIVSNHVKSTKHAESKKRLLKKEAREVDIAVAMKQYDDATHRKGETLPEEQRVYRVRVMKSFLRAGVPLAKLKYFRELLEEGAYRLTDTQHMLDMVPFILTQERDQVKKEVEGQCLSVIFDGTSRLGEVLVVVLRFIDDDFKIQQRLVRMMFLMKSLTGEETARELINVLSVLFSIPPHLLLAAMRDGASVNGVAMRTVSIVYPHVLDIGCVSHTLDLVGGRFKIPVLSSFVSLWISRFSHSPETRALWKEQTGKSMASFSKTRWWSRWEVMYQIMVQFGDVLPFLTNADLGSTVTRSNLLAMVQNTQQHQFLRVELASVVDCAHPIVKATYRLEGDGPLIFQAYEEIATVREAVRSAHYPSLLAVTQQIANGDSNLQQCLQTYGRECVRPGLEYFETKFGNDLSPPVSVFKAARLFSPIKVHEMKPVATDVDALSVFPFLNDSITINNLKGELPSYVAKASDVSPEFNVLEWWKRNGDGLPNWSSAARKVLVVQPLSAAAERVFFQSSQILSQINRNSL